MIELKLRAEIGNLMVSAFEDYLLCVRNIDSSKFDNQTWEIVRQINTICTQHSQAILQLILEEYLWESEILLRTVLEGSIKLAYICCEQNQIENKIFEFSHILPYINGQRRNKRIENILNIADLSEKTKDKDVYNKILQCDLPKIDKNMNRKNRNEIKRKWDFVSMVDTIEKCNLKEITNPSVICYPYGMMSNVVHMDFDGINYIYERFERGEKEQDKVNASQICRQYSDIYGLMFLRSLSLCLIYETDYSPLLKLPDKHKELLSKIEIQREKHIFGN